jgi:DNA-binding winged helix-turn-helix (wHTH) protein
MSDGKLRFDGWVLDPESGDLERGGARIRLQEQSTLVLKELIAHAGSVVTREHLIALLWPKGIVDFDTGLNTTIRKLRSALGDETGAPRYIETLPRRGYRFVGTLDAAPDAPTAAAASAVGSPAPMPTPAGAPTAHARASAAPGRSRNRTALVAACVVGLGIVGFAADRLWFSYRRAAATPAPTRADERPGASCTCAHLVVLFQRQTGNH